MKRWLLLILLAALSVSCLAQTNYTWPISISTTTYAAPTMGAQNVGYSSVVATQITANGPNPLSAGTAYWQAVDTSGNPISYQVNGAGQSILAPTVCTVTNGAIVPTCNVADTNLTNPVHLCFSLTIRDSSNNLVLGGPGQGYTCVQPYGATWSLDQYNPSIAGVPMLTVPVATIGRRGVVQAPNCLSLGSTYVPQTVNSDGSWTCLYTGNDNDSTYLDSNPQTSDSGLLQHKFPYATNVARISCSAEGSAVTINFDVRNEATPDTVGTSILSAPLTCPAGATTVVTTFASTSIPANSLVALDITSASGATFVRVHLETKQ